MNYSQLRRLSGVYFWSIVTVGVTYFASILWVFLQTFPGVLMLLVNLLDSRKFGFDLGSYGAMSQLWISLGLWSLSLVLLWRTLFSGIKIVQMIAKTRNFVKGLKIVGKKGNKLVFDSDSGEIFTAGLFHPKIYVANGLKKFHSSKEVRAMMLHETNHAKSRDPLRTTIAMMIESSLPLFPGKEKFIKYFYTLVEVCADKRAEEKLNSRLPLISALYKRMAMGNKALLAGISFFNSQSERICLLVGKKKFNQNIVLGVTFSTVLGVVVISLLVTQFNFYNCPHLTLCLSAITSVLELH